MAALCFPLSSADGKTDSYIFCLFHCDWSISNLNLDLTAFTWINIADAFKTASYAFRIAYRVAYRIVPVS